MLWALPWLWGCRQELSRKEVRSNNDERELLAATELVDYLVQYHSSMIANIDSLLTQQEIMSDLIPAILMPGTLLLCVDILEEEVSVVRLLSHEEGPTVYILNCESIDAIEVRSKQYRDSIACGILERATQMEKVW